ncbi:cation:proton antiporter [Albibacterium indicum]|uniref:cation:proton antiporter n=1 Tax=Albibacterium indicum TaxID=2292082 RepID=UPI000E528D32|nr:cation:proton antiporter [Pedobacter indicus]
MDKGFIEHIKHAFETPLSNPVLVFALILFIILLSPILLRKVKVPAIIGLIVSGVIIGPHALNILERNIAVDLFSTIGLLYIMFVAGLELDMNDFGKNKYKSLTFGSFTFLVPIIFAYPLFYFVFGYDPAASIMIAVMMATHTLVAFPVVTSYGIAKNEAVGVAIGGTILTDTAVLVALAVIVGFSAGALNGEFWLQMGISFSIFLFIMFVIIPRVAKWFFKKVEAEKTSHYIFVLSIVFFAAFIAEVCGLEPIIGAFMAGLALNRFIPHSSALMNRIDFIGNAIFIPFFLISVGMLVDVSVLINDPRAILIALALIAVSISGKWSAAFLTQKIFKYSVAQRQLIYGLSGAHAAATLAVIMVGFQNNIVGENVLNGAILLILVSCVIATFAAESASKKVVLEGDVVIEPNAKDEAAEEHIILPIANLNNMQALLDVASLIQSKKSPNPLTVLSVVPNNEMAEVNLKKARKNLDSIAKYASGSETEVNIMTTIDYNIAGGISRASKEVLATGILIGWPSKTSIVDKLVGGKAESILNLTDVSLFMCRLEKPLVGHKRIVLFVPPMAEAEKGFQYWLNKVILLTQELSLPVNCICNVRTQNTIEKYIQKRKVSINMTFENSLFYDKIQELNKYLEPEDFAVFVLARTGDVSYDHHFDSFPRRVSDMFPSSNLLLIYPSRRYRSTIDLTDIHRAPYAPGLETMGNLTRRVGNILRKDSSHDS